MAHLSPTVAAVFCLLSVFSTVIARSDLRQLALNNQLPESTSTEIPFSNPKPQSENLRWTEFMKLDEDGKTTDLKPDLRFYIPLVNRHWPGRLRHRRGCGHGPQIKPQNLKREISYGNDMIGSDDRTGRTDSEMSSVEFYPRQQGPRPRFVSLDEAEFKGPYGHHHHHDHEEHKSGFMIMQKLRKFLDHF